MAVFSVSKFHIIILKNPIATVIMAAREDHVYMAKLAEQAERYDDMVASMKEVKHVLFGVVITLLLIRIITFQLTSLINTPI